MIPQFPEFKKLELSDKQTIESITEKFEPYSDFNFVSKHSWNTDNLFEISKLKSLLVVKFSDYITNQPFLSFLGQDATERDIEILIQYSESNNLLAELKLVPYQAIEGIVSDKFSIEEDANNFDYIYSTSLLTTMSGGSFETKRNLINRFHKFTPNPSLQISDLDSSIDDNQILKLFASWHEYKMTQDEKFESEHELQAIRRLLIDREHLSLKILSIFSNDSLVGFSIFEVLSSKKAICHFAKINQNFTGTHDYMMQQQAKWLLEQGVELLNYEQDLGIETLRHSKLSFRPSTFLKKYLIKRK